MPDQKILVWFFIFPNLFIGQTPNIIIGVAKKLAVVPSEFSTHTEAAFVTIYLFGYDRVELGFIHSEFL